MASPIEQIKDKLDIVDLIQSYLKLEKAGTNFKVLCPFHKEKNPSFYVSPSRQIWHCFSCGLGGDQFRFIMEMEKVEFPEALKILAKMTGVELRREDKKLASQKNRLSEILSKTKESYKNNLKEREDVKNYLFERGIKEKTIEDFELGYAKPGWDNLYQYLFAQGFSKDELESSGLVIENHDRFRSRIIFPIFNQIGETVGFSGRIFEKDFKGEELPAKYINTPNTLLYDKSNILYGLNSAKNEIRKRNFCILVEGQTDLLMSHQAGFLNTVAISGTSLTEEQLIKLKRLTNNLFIALDPDFGGVVATKRGIDLSLKKGFEIKVLPLDKNDPAEIIKQNPQDWLELIKKAKSIIKYYLEFLNERIKEKRELGQQVERIVLPYIASIQSSIDQAHWIKEVANFLNLKEEAVWESFNKHLKKLKKEGKKESGEENQNLTRKARRDLLEEKLIGLLLWKRELVELFEKDWQDYFSSARKILINKILNKEIESDLEHYPKKLSLEAEIYYKDFHSPENEIKNIALELKREYLKDELEILSQKLRECEMNGDKNGLENCLKEFHKITQEINK